MTGAILLAGGRATRVGGAAKPLFDVGGASLLQRAVAAVADTSPLTVVADPVSGIAGMAHGSWVREDPPFAGPAAAIVVALGSWEADPEWTFVLACDLPGVAAAVARLRGAAPLLSAESGGVCLGDDGGKPQWLTGLYRTSVLRAATDALPDRGRDAPVRALLRDAAITVLPAPEDEIADVDTWEDLHRARARFGAVEEGRP